jgi:SNF2 family DNA or RNA helicase
VLDEAHMINKREKVRHVAIKVIPAKSYIIMSGTLPHNKWHDMSGYVDFLQGHPFTNHSKFLHTFGSFSSNSNIQTPHISRIRLLQRFLQAFLIAIPASVLNLQDVIRNSVEFLLTPSDMKRVNSLTTRYWIAIHGGKMDAVDFDQDLGNILSWAVMAQMVVGHPMMVPVNSKENITARGIYSHESGEFQFFVEEDLGSAQRDEWLRLVKERLNLVEESGRVACFIKLFKWVREQYPEEKIVVFSAYLKFLDILVEALSRTHNIKALRYDGSVLPSKRSNIEQRFQQCSPDIPLLITAGTGESLLSSV